MGKLKEKRQYVFTVEGDTEKWYLDWLQNTINNTDSALYTVVIKAYVEKDPMHFAKTTNNKVTPSLTHICDIESNNSEHINAFHNTLKTLKAIKTQKKIKCHIGYSNYTFELWMVLHKINCNGCLIDRSKYLPFINEAFGENYRRLNDYKVKQNFNRCLAKLSLDDVKKAINNAELIEKNNVEQMKRKESIYGYSYYIDNPSLTIWQSIKQILSECKLL